MVRTYLGYGYTNSEGVATLDYDAEDNPLPKKSYACHSRNTSVVAEVSVDNVVTSSNCIRFCENYVPPTDSLSLSCDKSILSYSDNDSCTLTATYEGTNVSGKSVVFKIGDTVLDTVNTDSNGIATYEYESQGVGDVTFTVEYMNLQETYSITDAWKYIDSGSYTGTSSISFQELYESSAYDNIEISATIKAPNKGFSLAFLKSKDSSSSIQDNLFTIGVDGGNYITVARIENGNSTVYTSNLFQQYTANSDLNCVIRIENGVVTLKLNSYTYTSTPITGLKYVGVRNWNNDKTVTYTDLKIKPL